MSKQYTPTERTRLVAQVDRLRQGGHGLLAACKQVGISDKSYHLWRKAIPMRAVEVTALVPVSVTGLSFAAPKAVIESLALLAPGGYRIEGLGIDTVVAFLRALAC
jgi:hypothetical protein